jgi:hypothetical protein
MEQKVKTNKVNNLRPTKQRRATVLARLEAQLVSKTKNVSEKTKTGFKLVETPLTEKDVKRIQTELATLKSRL